MVSFGAGEGLRSTRLDNGVHVLTDAMRGVRSVAAGVWVRGGAAGEPPQLMGASHLLEHVVFKGSVGRSARQIALALEGLGGSLNGYTAREHTGYRARLPGAHLSRAVEVLSDLVLNPLLRQEDLDQEKSVVLEEIAALEDAPEDLVFEVHDQRMWGEHPYGSPVLGTPGTLAAISRRDLLRLHRRSYVGANLVVAAAGHVDHKAFVDWVREGFGDAPTGEEASGVPLPTQPEPGMDRVVRDSGQVHIVTGWPTPGHAHPDRYALVLLYQILGGGMSSRLFQRVREELALVYSVYSFHSTYSKAGVFGVYAGTRPGGVTATLDAVREVYRQLRGAGPRKRSSPAPKNRSRAKSCFPSSPPASASNDWPTPPFAESAPFPLTNWWSGSTRYRWRRSPGSQAPFSDQNVDTPFALAPWGRARGREPPDPGPKPEESKPCL